MLDLGQNSRKKKQFILVRLPNCNIYIQIKIDGVIV